ncbi:hypothetical protein E2I00_011822, partial [Balaenoptera physalus]
CGGQPHGPADWTALPSPGARCEANTFDGERCLYGAQSDAIRRALRDYKQVTASYRRRDCYYRFLLRLLEQGIHSDVLFLVHGKSFRAHRCILGARSTYFAHVLDTKWKGRSVVVLRHPLINPVAFGALLQYLYTGCLDVGVEHVGDCERLAKQCQLWDLLGDLEAKRDTCPDVCFRVDGYSFLCHKLPPELAYDVLRVADMYLLPGLKQLCGRGLAQLLDEDSVVGDQCTKYMAKVLEKVSVGPGRLGACPEPARPQLAGQRDFVEAVREEAAAVTARQETDSIPLVDDIRFHVGSTVQ